VTGASLSVHASSLEVTHEVAAALASMCRPGDLFVLAGEMGAGKTAFAQGFGRALGVAEPMTSPTFTLVHSYVAGRLQLHHADVYRLDRVVEVADLALEELVEGDGVVLVEWGDVVAATLGDHLEVRLSWLSVDVPAERCITVRAIGRSWATRWPRISELVGAIIAREGSC
jgi:tRNA threonylcarbamoyladenosine biosynthesis protein TsaE